MIRENIDEFKLLGVDENTLGSHLCCKGAITLVSTGCTTSLPMASICLRAGWSMGNVKDRYIFYKKAGDQFCGRCVTSISSLTKKFAVSPVYWDFTKSGERGKKAVKKTIEELFAKEDEVPSHIFFYLQRFVFILIFWRIRYQMKVSYGHLLCSMHVLALNFVRKLR